MPIPSLTGLLNRSKPGASGAESSSVGPASAALVEPSFTELHKRTLEDTSFGDRSQDGKTPKVDLPAEPQPSDSFAPSGQSSPRLNPPISENFEVIPATVNAPDSIKPQTNIAEPDSILHKPLPKTNIALPPNSAPPQQQAAPCTSVPLVEMQKMFLKLNNSLHTKWDSVVSSMQELERKAVLRDKLVTDLTIRLKASEDRTAQLQHRVDVLEGVEGLGTIKDVSLQLTQSHGRINSLQSQITALEQARSSTVGQGDAMEGWVPGDAVGTKIVLCGDSNSSGKIRFGEERGTLGAALPGDTKFTPCVRNLPTDPAVLRQYSDIIIATGTNDLKEESCVPDQLATECHQYVSTVVNSHRNVQVYLPGVLPTSCADTNARINVYNRHLNDIARSHHRVTFIDTGGFKSKEGVLADRFKQQGDRTGLHLNDSGIKIYASKFKHALRLRHNLPNIRPQRSRTYTRPNNQGDRDSDRGRGRGGRGSGRGRR